MVVGRGLLVVEIVEADIHTQRIHRVVAHTHREQGWNICRHLHTVSILTGSLRQLTVELLFDHAHGSNDSRIAELVLSILQTVGHGLGLSHALLHSLRGNALCHCRTEIVLKVTDGRCLVDTLVLQSHTCLELILRCEVPTAETIVHTDDRGETETFLVTVQLDVAGIGLRRVENLIERHVAHLNIAYIAIIAARGVDGTHTGKDTHIGAQLVGGTYGETIIIGIATHVAVEAVLAVRAKHLRRCEHLLSQSLIHGTGQTDSTQSRLADNLLKRAQTIVEGALAATTDQSSIELEREVVPVVSILYGRKNRRKGLAPKLAVCAVVSSVVAKQRIIVLYGTALNSRLPVEREMMSR